MIEKNIEAEKNQVEKFFTKKIEKNKQIITRFFKRFRNLNLIYRPKFFSKHIELAKSTKNLNLKEKTLSFESLSQAATVKMIALNMKKSIKENQYYNFHITK